MKTQSFFYILWRNAVLIYYPTLFHLPDQNVLLFSLPRLIRWQRLLIKLLTVWSKVLLRFWRSFWWAHVKNSFQDFFFYKTLTGFVSWGNQITGVIIVCTSQQLLWFPSVCTVQLQAVEAVSFTRGTTHKHGFCGELWRSSGDGWEAAEVSAVQNIYLRVKLGKKENKIVPHKHLGVFCDLLPNLPVKYWNFFNLSELKDIFTALWKGVQMTISRSVSHISDSVPVRFTHMHRLKQYIDRRLLDTLWTCLSGGNLRKSPYMVNVFYEDTQQSPLCL